MKLIEIICLITVFLFVVLNEIYERADWLAEMEEIGEGRAHRPVIQAQIAERLRLIKKLEQKQALNDE